MGDIYCVSCGEPWDAYGVRNGDMTEPEAKKFLAGKGCPSCKFKKKKVSLQDRLDAAESECDWSDEDPIEILARRNLI